MAKCEFVDRTKRERERKRDRNNTKQAKTIKR